MNDSKTARAPMPSDGIARVEHPQPLVKTQELPAFDATLPEAVPCAITEGDVTVPVRSSIESTLTFEMLRRQSSKDDGDEGKR